MHGIIDTLLLNATAVSDLKETRSSEPKTARGISAILESTKVSKNTINIHLPLMIFIRRHSQESQFNNK